MMKKANETLNEGMKTLGFGDQSQRSLLSSLIPGLRSSQGGMGGTSLGQAAAGLPILSTLSQAIPSMRNMPGLETGGAAAGQPVNPQLNSAIEQVTNA
ncbi:unnamed protein product [Strongylus vulgaris]|uniref:Uncharacterized protein n=1 Tax=Strongylus vulgaris TaxID=40348 RepID=A0A3P7J5K2_STRVU|nr:unnamed protein product [Strongylus vulgaris]